MQELWLSMKVDYTRLLEERKDRKGLASSEARCLSFVNACIEEFEATFKDDFATTPYGKDQVIISGYLIDPCCRSSGRSSPTSTTTPGLRGTSRTMSPSYNF
jgi:hypothetical protein